MSLGSGIFLFLALLCLIVFCILAIPIRIHFCIEHLKQWHLSCTVGLWCKQKQMQLPDKIKERVTSFLQHSMEHETPREQSMQIYWKPIIKFLREAFHIAARRIQLERLYINCRIGWERADYTAYSYGVFWALVSFLPIQWREHSEMIYEPDFQTVCKDIVIQGIICCRVGQLIGILIAWFWLIVQMMLEQNREEQKQYEN